MKMISKNLFRLSGFIIFMGIFSCSAPKSDNEETSEEGTAETLPEDTRASPLKNTEGTLNNKSIKIQYGSPAVKDRGIWGDLVPYDEVWRTGANEATFVELEEAMMVEGEPLGAGKYSLFTIPRENGDWTVIFNKDWDLEHGHFQYDEEKDVLRVTAAPEWTDSSQEWLSIAIVDTGIEIKWEKLKLPIHIE